jgi:hypothetical protein
LTNLESFVDSETMVTQAFDYRAISKVLGSDVGRKERARFERGTHDSRYNREGYRHAAEPLFRTGEPESFDELLYETQLVSGGHLFRAFLRSNWAAADNRPLGGA